MILDAFLQFTGGSPNSGTVAVSNGGDSPTGGATLTGSNIIDLAGPGLPASATSPLVQPFRDIGIGDNPAMKILIQVTTAFSAGTSLQVQLTGAPDNGSGAPGSFVVWWSTPVYTQAQLSTVGVRLMDMDMPRPPAAVAEPRFLQLQYVSVGANNGTLKGWIVLDRHDQVYNVTSNNILGGYAPGVVIAN